MSEHLHDVEDLALSSEHDRVRLTATGALNLVTGAKLEAIVIQLFDSGVDHVVVDLRQLSILDTRGLHALLTVRDRAAERHARLELIAGPGHVALLLHRAGLGARP